MTRLLRLLAAASVAAFLVAACGGGDDGTTASGGSTAPTSAATSAAAPTSAAATSDPGGGSGAASGTITIKDFAFGTPLTVKAGATITVVNQDGARHDVVADQGSAFKTPLLGQGEKATFTAPTTPGTYTFSCSVHRKMTGIGTLTVTA